MLTIQIISGFTQHEGHWNGCLELREKLLAELDKYSALSVRTRVDPWNADWAHVARQLHLLRNRYEREPFEVLVFAYSYGVGNGLVKLARHLDRYGIDVSHAVTCDGIYRHWFSLGNWRSLFGGFQITLPPNVKVVDAFHQEVSRPMGAKPIGSGSNLRTWKRLRLPHVEMDDAAEFHRKCLEVAAERVREVVRRPESVPADAPASEATTARICGSKD